MAQEQPAMRPHAEVRKGDPFDWFLRIPNRLDLVHSVRGLARSTCEIRGMDMEAMQEVLLVLTEVVNNAIEHVAGRGPGGYHEVDVQFGITPGEGEGTVVARVVDEGQGGIGQADFDLAAAPDLGNDRGRGLFLVRAYVDALQVSGIPGVGTEVRFTKRVRLGVEGGTE
jgi:anti-sigma regulatory factor (Ser/Thr protein kinase)